MLIRRGDDWLQGSYGVSVRGNVLQLIHGRANGTIYSPSIVVVLGADTSPPSLRAQLIEMSPEQALKAGPSVLREMPDAQTLSLIAVAALLPQTSDLHVHVAYLDLSAVEMVLYGRPGGRRVHSLHLRGGDIVTQRVIEGLSAATVTPDRLSEQTVEQLITLSSSLTVDPEDPLEALYAM